MLTSAIFMLTKQYMYFQLNSQIHVRRKSHRVNDLFLELDIGKLAYGYGLLHLPRMPEIKGRETVNFDPVEVDPVSIPYKDKIREKQRQLKLEENKLQIPQARKPKRKAENDAWSKKREKLKRKDLKKRLDKENEISRNKRKLNKLNDQEIDELTKEARLVKKLKSGKISKVEFERQIEDNDVELE